MKLFLMSLLGIIICIHSPLLLAVDEPAATPPEVTAVAKEKEADKETTEERPPSKETTNAAKKAVASVTAGEFDPQTYTCKQFLKDASSEGGMIGTALIWAHGYFSAVFGTDDTGPLNEEMVASIAQDFTDFCTENPKMNFSRAAKFLSKQ
jgi:hypothetical protein